MKIFRRVLYLCLVICLIALAIAVGVRLYMAEHYPKAATAPVFTEDLTAYYKQNPAAFKAYTQDIRASYDDSKNGSFFADSLIVVPDGEHLQITLRYNDSSLQTVAEKYDLPEIAAGEGLFRFKLYVSYNQTEGGTEYQTYETSYTAEMHKFMYQYIKIAFDGVDFENATWMRVDIYYGDMQEAFGSIAVYESVVELDGYRVEYPLQEYKIKKEYLPQ